MIGQPHVTKTRRERNVPTIRERHYFGGSDVRIERLGMRPPMEELEGILTGFSLLVEEQRNSNGAAVVRMLIDSRFEAAGDWIRKQTGDIDWRKCREINGTRICLGVEIQVSGRSDLLLIDVVHLRERINAGEIDVGVVVVPSNELGVFLTDRSPRFSDALKVVDRCRAHDLPLAILGIHHDGPGPRLEKRRTRQGR